MRWIILTPLSSIPYPSYLVLISNETNAVCYHSFFPLECSEYVTSFVLDSDMVARMSVHAMARLREEVLDCIGRSLLTVARYAAVPSIAPITLYWTLDDPFTFVPDIARARVHKLMILQAVFKVREFASRHIYLQSPLIWKRD